jgi:hypothetical protein
MTTFVINEGNGQWSNVNESCKQCSAHVALTLAFNSAKYF